MVSRVCCVWRKQALKGRYMNSPGHRPGNQNEGQENPGGVEHERSNLDDLSDAGSDAVQGSDTTMLNRITMPVP